MNLLVDKSLFIVYLKNSLVKTKSKNFCNLIQIFENEENKFLLTASMIERIESEISDSTSLLYDFQGFVRSLVDSKRFLAQNIKEKTEEEEIIKVYSNNCINDNLFVFLDKHNVAYQTFINQCCVWSNIKKPNKDWIILYLVSVGQINVRYSDFTSDAQIETFFYNYFKLSSKCKDVIILDSYCNYYGINLFNVIRGNGYAVSVYTSSFLKKENEKTQLRNSVREHFNKSTKIKFSSDKKLIHERSILIDDFILESNHDFAEIKRKNRNWKIDITYDHLVRKETESKCEAYN